MMLNETYELANGVAIPKIGLGTWLMDDGQAAQAVEDAIAVGYRHIDTAQAYANEEGVGRGVRDSGVAREEIFVTTKVAAEAKDYEAAAASIDASLEKLGMDHIDLLIIHSPQPWVEVNQSDNRYFDENREVWRAMEDAYDAGKVRAIGVSNFLEEDLANILDGCRIKPMVDQVLCHVGNTPVELIDFCREQGIQVEAYSPIAHGVALKDEAIVSMADKYGVSAPQLCIRYDLQLGLVVLPKTTNPTHMRGNADVDFEIAGADMETLMNVVQLDDYGDSNFFPVYGGKL